MSRYDIAIGKKYSEPKLRKEEKFTDLLQSTLTSGSGVTTNRDTSNYIPQRGIECTINTGKREYQGRFLSYHQGQDDVQTKTFDLTIELPGFVNTDTFFGVHIHISLNGTSTFINCYTQNISTNFNVDNNTTQIHMSGVETINDIT